MPLEAARQHLEALCGDCRRRPPAYSRLLALWRYEEPAAAVVAGLKYRRLHYLGAELGEELAARHPELATEDALVTSVPLHWRRRLARGFDQAAAIAHPFAQGLGLEPLPLLARRPGRPQVGLPRHRRLTNPRGSFVLARRRRPGIAGRPVLLVDDVATTGATLDAAAAELRAAGASRVTAVVVARAEPE